jgi:cell division protein ZapA
MSTVQKTLDIRVMGRDFRVACPENEERELLAAVDYLEKKMLSLREKSKVIGVERIAILAALDIAHEFLSTKVPGGFDMAEFKRRMNSMRSTIEQAMSAQDELF